MPAVASDDSVHTTAVAVRSCNFSISRDSTTYVQKFTHTDSPPGCTDPPLLLQLLCAFVLFLMQSAQLPLPLNLSTCLTTASQTIKAHLRRAQYAPTTQQHYSCALSQLNQQTVLVFAAACVCPAAGVSALLPQGLHVVGSYSSSSTPAWQPKSPAGLPVITATSTGEGGGRDRRKNVPQKPFSPAAASLSSASTRRKALMEREEWREEGQGEEGGGRREGGGGGSGQGELCVATSSDERERCNGVTS